MGVPIQSDGLNNSLFNDVRQNYFIYLPNSHINLHMYVHRCCLPMYTKYIFLVELGTARFVIPMFCGVKQM
jgi:hypothetical protein